MAPREIKKVEVVSNLDTISDKATATVQVKDLVFIHAVMAELNQFFHQGMHFPSDPNVERYMSKEGGDAYALIHEVYYETLSRMLPKDVFERICEGDFDQPEQPYYFSPENIVGGE